MNNVCIVYVVVVKKTKGTHPCSLHSNGHRVECVICPREQLVWELEQQTKSRDLLWRRLKWVS